MTDAVRVSAPILKERGFRKRRHSFNRRLESGLVHVVTFRMVPAWSSSHGTFWVEFGVHVPEMVRRHHSPRTDWIYDYDANARVHLGPLMNDDEAPVEWDLADPDAGRMAIEAVVDYGLPWLNQFPDHDSILAAHLNGEEYATGIPAAGLAVAVMLEDLGREVEARAVLEAYVDKPVLRNHAEHLREWLPAAGHVDLVPRITIETE